MTTARKSRFALWLVLGVVLGLLFLGSLGLFEERRGHRPSETRRFRQAHTPKPPVAVPPADDSSQLPDTVPLSEVRVFVLLDDSGVWHPVGRGGFVTEPWKYWPDREEAPWPNTESSESLQLVADALMNRGEAPAVNPMDTLLENAQAEGLMDAEVTDLMDDPWEALVAMQAAHVSEVLETGFLSCDGDDDYSRSFEIAAEINEEWGDDPSADYARLHLIWLQGSHCNLQYSPRAAVDLILDIIAESEDEVVLQAAASVVSELTDDLEDEDLKELTTRWEDLDLDTREVVANLWIQRGLESEDKPQVDLWSDRLRSILDALCTEDAEACAQAEAHWADLKGFQVSRDEIRAHNWRQELVSNTRRCHADTPLDRGEDVTGIWDGADWKWEGWKVDAPLGPCLENADWQTEPEADLRVRLTVSVR